MPDVVSDTALIPYRRAICTFDQYTNIQILNTDKKRMGMTSATFSVI